MDGGEKGGGGDRGMRRARPIVIYALVGEARAPSMTWSGQSLKGRAFTKCTERWERGPQVHAYTKLKLKTRPKTHACPTPYHAARRAAPFGDEPGVVVLVSSREAPADGRF